MYLSKGFSSSCSPRDWSLDRDDRVRLSSLSSTNTHASPPCCSKHTHTYTPPPHHSTRALNAHSPRCMGEELGGVHRSLTAVTPARQVAREMPHHLKRLAVARRAPLKRPKTAEEGDGAHNVICLKWTNKRKSSRLERLLQRDALGTLASQNCRDRGSSV